MLWPLGRAFEIVVDDNFEDEPQEKARDNPPADARSWNNARPSSRAGTEPLTGC
jgi:hypothetical protein